MNDMLEMMKNETIGVEVEMNNITRADASKLASEYFGTGRYKDTAFTNGYRCWSAWDAQNREWKFQYDCSIGGFDESQKCEMVTPILKYEDIELLQGLVRVLRKAGAKSDATRGCGVHIHIGANGHDAKTLRNLANIMAGHETLLTKALKLDENRTSRYCKPVSQDFLMALNAEKPETMEALAEVWYTRNHASYGRNQHYNESRYHMLNLHATFTKGTVEFRLFQFDAPEGDKQNGLHAGQLKAYIQLCLGMSCRAKMVKSANPKERQMENPKFAMAKWMTRLGFVGDEFKTARELFTKRLAGNARVR